MRPRLEHPRDRLATVLGRQPAASARELAAILGVSVPTLHRMLAELDGRVLAAGKARRVRYALRRPLRGVEAELPVYRVDRAGRIEQVASLSPIMPQGCRMDLAVIGWPAPEEARDGWWEGLPYPLYDMRPQGYMGRQFARAEHRRFGVAENPEEWDDDDVLHVLSQTGSDVSGDLVVGEAACLQWQENRSVMPEPLEAEGIGEAYGQLAERAVAAGIAGSSAAGEFPKFSAMRRLPGSATPHVLVKFSGADDSATVTRWADLLVCEHLALECAANMPGVESAASRIVRHAGRTFLEVERFDRHGDFGRSPLCSLGTLDAALLGADTRDWGRLAERFTAAGLLSPADVHRIECLWWYGRLIANIDMHTGNLSFRPAGGRLALAPAYDMLPMQYAPLPGGELPVREFKPPPPLPQQRPAWRIACEAAQAFWSLAASDGRISAGFREVCGANGKRLSEAAMQV